MKNDDIIHMLTKVLEIIDYTSFLAALLLEKLDISSQGFQEHNVLWYTPEEIWSHWQRRGEYVKKKNFIFPLVVSLLTIDLKVCFKIKKRKSAFHLFTSANWFSNIRFKAYINQERRRIALSCGLEIVSLVVAFIVYIHTIV